MFERDFSVDDVDVGAGRSPTKWVAVAPPLVLRDKQRCGAHLFSARLSRFFQSVSVCGPRACSCCCSCVCTCAYPYRDISKKTPVGVAGAWLLCMAVTCPVSCNSSRVLAGCLVCCCCMEAPAAECGWMCRCRLLARHLEPSCPASQLAKLMRRPGSRPRCAKALAQAPDVGRPAAPQKRKPSAAPQAAAARSGSAAKAKGDRAADEGYAQGPGKQSQRSTLHSRDFLGLLLLEACEKCCLCSFVVLGQTACA